MKFNIWIFSENLSRKFKFHWIRTHNWYFTWRRIYVFDHISLSFS